MNEEDSNQSGKQNLLFPNNANLEDNPNEASLPYQNSMGPLTAGDDLFGVSDQKITYSGEKNDGEMKVSYKGKNTESLINDKILQQIAQIYTSVRNNDPTTLKASLSRDGEDFDMLDFRDAQGFTPLSLACFKNAEACFSLLFEHARQRISTELKKDGTLKRWVDTQNCEGFSALHFASFHGNYQMINTLIEQGTADINLANNQGCTVLHLAAQGNKALSIYYFAEIKALDINVQDKKQRTPLHWAEFTKSEIAQIYILGIKSVNIEAKDDNGFTALHLAV